MFDISERDVDTCFTCFCLTPLFRRYHKKVMCDNIPAISQVEKRLSLIFQNKYGIIEICLFVNSILPASKIYCWQLIGISILNHGGISVPYHKHQINYTLIIKLCIIALEVAYRRGSNFRLMIRLVIYLMAKQWPYANESRTSYREGSLLYVKLSPKFTCTCFILAKHVCKCISK